MKFQGTYGAWRIWRRENAKFQNGEAWLADTYDKPPQMSHDEALAYYNAKLHDAWMECDLTERALKKQAWRDLWFAASHRIENLPLRIQMLIKELFAYAYALGYEHGTMDRH